MYATRTEAFQDACGLRQAKQRAEASQASDQTPGYEVDMKALDELRDARNDRSEQEALREENYE